jgi:hypothetical protein
MPQPDPHLPRPDARGRGASRGASILATAAAAALIVIATSAVAGTRPASPRAATISRSFSPLVRRARLGAHLERTERALRQGGDEAADHSVWRRDPLLRRLAAASRGVRIGRTSKRLERAIVALVAVGGPIAVPGRIVDRTERLLYRAERAAALRGLGRRAGDLRARFLEAAPIDVVNLDGETVHVEGRSIHIETWAAIGEPRGIVRIAPGYQELGASFYALADALNREGLEVVLMDQQWAGSSRGDVAPGRVDSKEGIARDAAVVDGFIEADPRGLPSVAVGNSMGAGPGTLYEQVLVRHGRLAGAIGSVDSVDGRPITAPTRTPKLVALAPYVARTGGPFNAVIARLGRRPVAGDLAPPMLSRPRFSRDPGAEDELADLAARAGIAGRANAMGNGALSPTDRAALGPLGDDVVVVMGPRDSVASADAVRRAMPTARFVPLEGVDPRDHINQHTAAALPQLVAAIVGQLERAPRSTPR